MGPQLHGGGTQGSSEHCPGYDVLFRCCRAPSYSRSDVLLHLQLCLRSVRTPHRGQSQHQQVQPAVSRRPGPWASCVSSPGSSTSRTSSTPSTRETITFRMDTESYHAMTMTMTLTYLLLLDRLVSNKHFPDKK